MFGFRRPPTGPWEEQYSCFSVAYADKGHLEAGDKIILPPSAFDVLSRMEVEYPMLFKLTAANGNTTHVGVLEFSAQEGSCFIPHWCMENLLIEEGGIITVRNVSLPKAKFVKLQPQHVDFLDISNPRVVLEHALRTYSCVTKGDVIKLSYNDRNYHFELKEVEPAPAACIIETDVNIDFDAPLGYKEPDYKAEAEKAKKSANALMQNMPKQSRFGGSSNNSPAMSGKNSGSSSVGSNMDSLVLPDSATSTPTPTGTRIVDGNIIKGEDSAEEVIDSKLLAEKTGATGIQRNSALPPKPPTSTYWAVSGGSGSRLDGKAPSPLKDKSGADVNIREVRAEAARRREEKLREERGKSVFDGSGNSLTKNGNSNGANGSSGSSSGSGSGTGSGSGSGSGTGSSSSDSGVSRKSLIGNKFSKRKTSTTAFQGNQNTLK